MRRAYISDAGIQYSLIHPVSNAHSRSKQVGLRGRMPRNTRDSQGDLIPITAGPSRGRVGAPFRRPCLRSAGQRRAALQPSQRFRGAPLPDLFLIPLSPRGYRTTAYCGPEPRLHRRTRPRVRKHRAPRAGPSPLRSASAESLVAAELRPSRPLPRRPCARGLLFVGIRWPPAPGRARVAPGSAACSRSPRP